MTADGILAIAAVLAILVLATIWDRVTAQDEREEAMRDWLGRIAGE